MDVIYTYLLIINALSLLLMLADKIRAKKNAWRIPEAKLMSIALSGGCFGIYAGMVLFRHKTKHPKFSIGVPLIIVFYIFLFVGLLIVKRRIV